MSGFTLRLIGVYLLVTGASWSISFLMRMNGVAREVRPLYFFLTELWKCLFFGPLMLGGIILAIWIFYLVEDWISGVSSKQDTVSLKKDTQSAQYPSQRQSYLEQERKEQLERQKAAQEKREAEALEKKRLAEELRRTRSPEEATKAALRDF